MLYKIFLSTEAENDIHNALEYLIRNCSTEAYYAVCKDIEDTLYEMENNPYIFSEYHNDPAQRSAHLQKHQYKIVFFIKDNSIYITAFLHDLQDA